VTVRKLQESDIPTLKSMYQAQGFGYDFPDLTGPMMECVHVVVDDEGRLLCAVAAERIAQIYFLAGDFGPPHARLHAIRMLHESMGTELRQKGYGEANAFLPPSIADRFGRWLTRRFGWGDNWSSKCLKL
tara:strand:- start:85 stop:474 length:390 start_codon:yes stop_codon:yes gene_type:complete